MQGAESPTPKPESTTPQEHPLHGFLPRRVTATQVQKALEGDVNPFTNNPHSSQYKKILETRKRLPVYVQMAEFYKSSALTWYTTAACSVLFVEQVQCSMALFMLGIPARLF
ncbi:hypothetical protein JB92DRAFT_1945675 [Gautieria morchelliformis]|nr:hypothetical protein JB92DRAFT_1945675 [Gautieria morchelliformis]